MWIWKLLLSHDSCFRSTKILFTKDPFVARKLISPAGFRYICFRPNVKLAELLVIRGNLFIDRKQCELATKDAVAVIRMGRLMSQGPYHVYYIVQAIEECGFRLMARILQSQHLDQQSCQRFLDANIPDRPDQVEILRRLRLEVIEKICI